MDDRDYDVVLYGATGFTGRQTALYFRDHVGDRLRWAVAGRNQGKLDALPVDVPVEVADALATVHAAALVHRDVKPANVIVEAAREPEEPAAGGLPRGRAVLVDFGLVRPSDSTRTGSGAPAATPSYAAPEQLLGARVDARADVFALGAVLFELLTGRRAFPDEEEAVLLQRVKRGQVAELPNDRVVPIRMERALAAALARDPARRPQDAAALARQWLDGTARREPVWAPGQLARIAAGFQERSDDVTRTLTMSR